MDMLTQHPEQLIFHLGGRARDDTLMPATGLRPALLARYRDLVAVRHDFPVVLVNGDGPHFVRTLSGLVDAVLQEVAPRGIGGERLRRHALQLEREIRRAVDAGATGTLAELWDAAAARLGECLGSDEGQTLEQVLQHAGGALPVDGRVLGCTPEMPAQLVTQAWRRAQRDKARRFHADLGRLVQGLSDILRAAFSHSQAGRAPQSLQASVGGPHQSAFDFEVLSRIVGKSAPRDELPASRRERLQRSLAVLESQRFFAPHAGADDDAGAVHGFIFDNCAAAVAAHVARLDEAVRLLKALAVAELEVRGQYVEDEHDPTFEAFGAHSLTADDLARLPDYLVCLPPGGNDAPANANLMDMLSSGLPVKVLVQTSALLDDAAIGTGHFAFGVRSARLATTAMGLGGLFVLQSTAANLVALRGRIADGMACAEPALFSVYAAAQPVGGAVPPYLLASAAMSARVFPAFSYDAGAGGDWATRFSLENNPQPEDDWATQTLEFADTAQQRVGLACAFTLADFALCDPGQAAHFAVVPRERWGPTLMPAAEWLQLGDAEASHRVPYVLAVDAQDALQRVIVDLHLMQAARRCRLLWRRLQEHAGIHDSHAERLLAREKAAWAAAAPAAPPVAEADPAPSATEAPAHTRDEAWIDTARCPSCNECQLINDRMFGYDERQQAYIKDLSAGTYRQLVEAAESCQVAIIHPGQPRDPNEPGLEELLARAEPFR
jgi:hypothetical protein